MKIFKNIITTAITLIMLLSATIALAINEKEVTISYNDQKNGFFVSFANRDFPSRADLTKNEYIKEVDHMLGTAKKYNYNTIYFDAISFGQASFKSKVLPENQWIFEKTKFTKNYDPLEILIERANEQDILVVATIDPFTIKETNESSFVKQNLYIKTKGFTRINYENKQANEILLKAVKELASNYKINGLLLTNILDNNDYKITENLISNVYKTVKQINQSLSVGLKVNQDNMIEKLDYDFIKLIIKNTDYFVVDMKRSVENGYENYIKKWSAICGEYNKGLFVNNFISKYLSPSSDEYFIGNIPYIHNQIYFNNQYKINGTILDSYKSILMNNNSIADDLAVIYNDKNVYKESLEDNSHNLHIAITNNKINTDQEYYYFSGTSDPSTDLLVNDNIIKDRSNDGYFIYKASLNEGENIFKFSQNNELSQTIVINKVKQNIKKKIDYNPYPKYDEPVYEDGQVTLSITAPKDMKVGANFNNTIYYLTQSQFNNDIATYTAKITLPNISSEDAYKDLGNIIYSISDGNIVYNKKSEGKIILLDDKTKIKGSVKNFESNVYSYPDENSYITSTLREGAIDYIDEITEDYVHFSSIGYIKRSDININSNGISPVNSIINIALSSSKKSDVLTIVGTNKSPYKISTTDKSITVNLYNINDMPESLAHLKSDIFENISVNLEGKNSASLIFTLKEGKKLLGYDIKYDNQNIIIDFVHKPYVYKNNLKPLSGIDILIDAGSGGTNKDGLSPDGTSVGEINLYLSYILNHRLKALGANVYMSRTKDELLPLYDRTVRASETKPDLIISIDNDCYADNFNSKHLFKIKHLEKDKITQNFAVNIEKSVRESFKEIDTQILDTNNNIIKSTYCPSLSISFGNVFVPNIYKNIAYSFNAYKVIYTISNSIVDSFREI